MLACTLQTSAQSLQRPFLIAASQPRVGPSPRRGPSPRSQWVLHFSILCASVGGVTQENHKMLPHPDSHYTIRAQIWKERLELPGLEGQCCLPMRSAQGCVPAVSLTSTFKAYVLMTHSPERRNRVETELASLHLNHIHTITLEGKRFFIYFLDSIQSVLLTPGWEACLEQPLFFSWPCVQRQQGQKQNGKHGLNRIEWRLIEQQRASQDRVHSR